jgi:hypothetical protein
MEINRTRWNPPGLHPVTNGAATTAASSSFGKSQEAGALQTMRAPSVENAFTVLTTKFRRADLKDPAKLDSMLESAFSELLRIEHPPANRLSVDQRQELIHWMKSDPLLRRRVIGHLEQILV